MFNEKKLYLTKNWITVLFVYYFIVFFVGISLALFALVPDIITEIIPSILQRALIGSIGMTLNGSSIFYVRKLYKLCFQIDNFTEDKNNIYLQKLGTITYFLGRPLFAIGFSILVVIGLKSGFMLTSVKPIELNDGFIFLAMFISFFVGFRTGHFVKQLEVSGEKLLNNVVNAERKNVKHPE